jgi:hypothetical protein
MNCKWKGTGSVGNDIPGKNKPKDRQVTRSKKKSKKYKIAIFVLMPLRKIRN